MDCIIFLYTVSLVKFAQRDPICLGQTGGRAGLSADQDQPNYPRIGVRRVWRSGLAAHQALECASHNPVPCRDAPRTELYFDYAEQGERISAMMELDKA